MEEGATPPLRALDRLSDHTSTRTTFRLGGGLKRRLITLGACITFVLLFAYLGAKAGYAAYAAPPSTGYTRNWRPPEGGYAPAAGGEEGEEEKLCNVPTGQQTTGYGPWGEGEMRAMVGRTKGYYVRDWSLGLGWGQVRIVSSCGEAETEDSRRCGSSSKQRSSMPTC